MKSTRMSWVDGSKGLGILLVIFGHILMGVELAGVPINNFFYQKCILFVYSFHMPLFFILTGLFFEKIVARSPFSSFVVDKLKILVYPFIIWTIIQTSIEVLLSKYTNNHASVSKLFYALIIPSGHFWFLIALFLYNVVNAFLFRFAKKHWLLISFIISFLLFELPIHLPAISYQKIVDHFIYMNFGILIARYFLDTDAFTKIAKPVTVIFSVLCFLAVEYVYLFTGHGNLVWAFFLPQVLGVLVTVQICMWFTINKLVFFEGFGHYSFPIYLLHMLLIAGTRTVLQKIFHINDFWVYLLALMPIGAYVPILFYKSTLISGPLKWLFFYPGNKDKKISKKSIGKSIVKIYNVLD